MRASHETGFLNIEEDEWRRIIDVNLTSAFFVAQAVARKMVSRRRGAIVHMASKNGLDGESGYVHYNASKAGLVLLRVMSCREGNMDGHKVIN
jgi:3-oxoacyl-[acyl-carrier protein] reductase